MDNPITVPFNGANDLWVATFERVKKDSPLSYRHALAQIMELSGYTLDSFRAPWCNGYIHDTTIASLKKIPFYIFKQFLQDYFSDNSRIFIFESFDVLTTRMYFKCAEDKASEVMRLSDRRTLIVRHNIHKLIAYFRKVLKKPENRDKSDAYIPNGDFFQCLILPLYQ